MMSTVTVFLFPAHSLKQREREKEETISPWVMFPSFFNPMNRTGERAEWPIESVCVISILPSYTADSEQIMSQSSGTKGI